MIRKFELNEKEEAAYIAFTKKFSNEKLKKTKIIFSFCGIGTGITVKVGKKKKDITDYSSW